MARAGGWVPNQHGAWAMLVVPALVGTCLQVRGHGLQASTLPLLVGWLLGYLCFHATSMWLKSRRRPRYRRPALVYGALTAALGALTLALDPGLLGWAPVVAPLLAIGLWEAHRRRERSLLSGAVTVIAACLLVPVLAIAAPFGGGASSLGREDLWGPTVTAWWACTLYFLGTVLVVKTMIRERGSRTCLAASIGWHAVATLVAVVLGHLGLALFFVACTARATLLPWLARRGLRIRPLHLGLVEIVLCVVLTTLVLT